MFKTREQWLQAALQRLRTHFANCGYEVPAKVRVSCGLPSVKPFAIKRRVGEAWCSKASRDQHFEIFISPTLDKPHEVLATLVHEVVHVTVGLEAGHKGKFAICAKAVGLTGPMTSTEATAELAKKLAYYADVLDDYPHRSLEKMTNARKKDGTRLIKVGCPECTYTTRIAMKWILTGVPRCPNEECGRYEEVMEVDLPEADVELLDGGQRLNGNA